MKTPDATSLGQNATFTNKSDTVTLTTAVTADITTCEAAWTAGAGTVSVGTQVGTRKQGTVASSFAFNGSFSAPGIAAYFATGTLNLSSYQQISFWIFTDSNLSANAFRIDLCSDTAGATPVNSFTIDQPLFSSKWIPITIDNGAALGSSIQSIALYGLVNPGTPTVIIDNIIACKASSSADSLTLRSLIGKNTGSELWYPIRSISGTTIKLDSRGVDSISSTVRGYSGTTATTTIYKREPGVSTKTDTTAWGSASSSGSAGSLITFSGGWDTTAMTSQTGDTYVDTKGSDFISAVSNYVSFDHLYGVRSGKAFEITGQNGTASNIGGIGCTRAIDYSGKNWTFTGIVSGSSCSSPMLLSSTGSGTNDSYADVISLSTSSGNGIQIGNTTAIATFTGTLTSNNSSSNGITLLGTGKISTLVASDNGADGLNMVTQSYGPFVIGSGTFNSNTGYGINITDAAWVTVNAFTSAGNQSGSTAINFSPAYNSHLILKSPTYTETNLYTAGSIPQGSNSRIQIEAVNGSSTTHKTQYFGGTIQSETSVRHTASGLAWKLSPTSTVRDTNNPVRMQFGPYGCAASNLVTITAWVRRTTSNVSARIVVPGGQIAGVASDVVVNSTGSGVGAYEQLTLTFTPSAAGGFVWYFEAFGGTTDSAYIDDISTTQA